MQVNRTASKTRQSPRQSAAMGDNSVEGTGHKAAALALGFTAAIVAFIGVFVVLSIPFAILSVPLPPSVNRVGLVIATTQELFFERSWYLLAPAALIALGAGYRSYRWYCSTVTFAFAATSDEGGAGGQE